MGSAPSTAPAAPLAIRRKKAQALLAYLALHPGAASSRDSLAGLLWSGTTDEHARHNLRQTLFALRQAITPDPFIVEGELVGLRENAVHVDVAAFERGVGRGTREALREATSAVPRRAARRASASTRRRSTTGSRRSGNGCGSWR